MTTSQSTNEMPGSLDQAFAGHQLQLVPESETAAPEGPVMSVTMVPAAEAEEITSLIVAVATERDVEALQTLVAVVQEAHPELIAQDPVVADSVRELRAPGGPNADIMTVMSAGEVEGAVVVSWDRRDTGDAAAGLAKDDLEAAPMSADAPDLGRARAATAPPRAPHADLTRLRDVLLEVTVELGRQSLTLAHVLNLAVGSVVELDRPAGTPVDIRVNGLLFGRGEVVVVDDEYAVRIIEIIDASDTPC
ncbi:MAG: flagellar motor switch protein FliN/FliY [Acidimicrobiales bacterium]|jgi:flagellar motor switch protein FliN/FliY